MRRVLLHGPARSLPAQTVVTFVLVAGLLRLARSDRAVTWWLAESLIVTAVAVGIHLSRRRTDSRAIDVTERELPVLDRQLRQREIPEETDRRYAMRRLVTYRTRQLERTDWLVPVFLCFMGFAPLIYLLDGAWLMGVGALIFVVLFGWWLVSMRRRNRKLLRRMDDELDQMSRKVSI